MPRGLVLPVVGAVVAAVAATTPAVAATDPTPQVVVLGDSYVSGEGLPSASGPCGRTSASWGVVAGRELGDPDPENLACSGAAVADVTVGGRDDPTAQLDRLAAPVDVAVLVVGGNDIGFAELVAGCLDLDGDVDPDAFEGAASGTAWRDLVASGARTLGCDTSPAALLEAVDGLLAPDRFPLAEGGTGGLADVYVQVAERALVAGGTLAVATYPALFQPPDGWSPRYGRRCHGVLAADAAAFASVTSRLAEVVAAAAATASERLGDRARVVVADVEAVARGAAPGPGGETEPRGLCGPGQPWVNGLTLVEGGIDPSVATAALLDGDPVDLAAVGARPTSSFHPNTAGHAAIADVLVGSVTADVGRGVGDG